MGFDESAYALYKRAEFVAYAMDALGRLAVQILDRMLDYTVVKAIRYSDDLAYRIELLISPAACRRYLFPWMKQIGERCRRANRLLLFHSDGVLWEVMDDLIACGTSALHPIEPIWMDIRQVKRRYGDSLAIVGNVELNTLARGTAGQVRDQVRRLLSEIAPGGAYRLGSSNIVPNYARLDNYRAMLEEAWQPGRYPISF